MAKKNKAKKVVEEQQQQQIPEVEAQPMEEAVPVAQEPAPAAEPKLWVVNCHRCGAALHVQEGNMVYMCPVCNNLFRVRKCEKLVKDVSPVIVAEAYVNVNKGKDEK